jgi:hypothetical protein
MSPLLLQVCYPFSVLFLINAINNLYLRWTFICSGRGDLYLIRALGGWPMASGRGGPRQLVASKGGGRASDVQSHRPKLGGRQALCRHRRWWPVVRRRRGGARACQRLRWHRPGHGGRLVAHLLYSPSLKLF